MSLAVSMRLKLRLPVGCDFDMVRQNGHEKVAKSSRMLSGRSVVWNSATTSWWYTSDVSSKRGVPLM